MANRFFTVLLIPEKTSPIRRWVIPGWLFRGLFAAVLITCTIAIIMLIDYGWVIKQVSEYKDIQAENRQLKAQVEAYKDKMDTLESTVDRIKSFTTRIKIITHVEELPSAPEARPQPKLENPSARTAAAPLVTPPAAGVPVSQAAGQSATIPPSLQPPEDFGLRFAHLNQESQALDQMLQTEYEGLASRKSFLAALPTRKPAVGYFSSGFGVRKAPFGGREKMHEGVDLAGYPGTPVQATADGVVAFSATKAGYGQTLVINHGYGLETWYGHLKKLLVTQGQKVRRGDQIALLGNSGLSTGPHVHYEVRVHGTPVDPLSYILEN